MSRFWEFDTLLSSYVKHVGRCESDALVALLEACLSGTRDGARHAVQFEPSRRCIGDVARGVGVCGCGTFVQDGVSSGRAVAAEVDDTECVYGAREFLSGSQRQDGFVGDEGKSAQSGIASGTGGFGDTAGESGEVRPFVRGKWYGRNKRRRELKKAGRFAVGAESKCSSREHQSPGLAWRRSAVPVGTCETVLSAEPVGSDRSSCPSYGQALSDAEKEAKETLARRRAAENKLNEKLALMKIASLEDEKKCQEYADLKRSRVIQWTNEAVAKSQQSLDKCKTIDPASSSSQADIRAQAKELADVKAHFDQFARRVSEFVPNCGELLDSCKAPGTATMDFLIAQAACSSNAGSVDPLDITDDMDVKVQGYVRARGYKAERFPVLTDEVIFD